MPRALISVYDKTGLLDLSRGLLGLGWDLLATGGTLRALQEAGLAVTEVAAFTGAPECFDGRVKTLHPKIHGGLLHRRDLETHRADAERLGIPAIDLVVVNLYPFEATIAKAGASFEDCIEQIDIGGPSMVRSAAKNHHSVTVLTAPDQYAGFLDKLQAGTWDEADRRRCALEAFRTTAAYDAAISTWLGQQVPEPAAAALPARITLGLREKQSLRYGENPHQKAAFHVQAGHAEAGLAACRQLQGKELSYNNFLDADSAGRLVHHLPAPGCVIVKHNNPCGVAQGSHALEAFHRALASDPVSAFGGIVAFNRPVGAEVAREMAPTFWEVILAPSFTAEACEILGAKKQLRLLEIPERWPAGADGLMSAASAAASWSRNATRPSRRWSSGR